MQFLEDAVQTVRLMFLRTSQHPPKQIFELKIIVLTCPKFSHSFVSVCTCRRQIYTKNDIKIIVAQK